MIQSFGKREDGDWVEARGQVRRLLADDEDDGESHQRFVVTLPGGQTLLIAHNTEVAERIPLGLADRVRFRGLYVYNDSGGVVHFTHRDPHGREAGGWVEFRGKRYS